MNRKEIIDLLEYLSARTGELEWYILHERPLNQLAYDIEKYLAEKKFRDASIKDYLT